MKNILISPFSKKLINGKENPKNFPIDFWEELIINLKTLGHYVYQCKTIDEQQLEKVDGYYINLSLKDLSEKIKECDLFISVDNMFQHLAWSLGKKGIVLFTQSDPTIFGHKENINLLKDRKYLKKNQFNTWVECEVNKDSFIDLEEVINKIME